jgi:DNA-binding NarL/FixJ family response regulator
LRGLADLLAPEARLKVVCSCTDGAAALEAARGLKPDIAIVDVRMPKVSGLRFLQAVRKEGLPTRIVLLSAQLGDAEIFDAVNGGASAIIFKDAATDNLLECVLAVLAGRSWLDGPAEVAYRRESESRERARKLWSLLTEREREVALLAARNVPNKQIAWQIGITEGTAKLHLNHIYAKLNIANRAELIGVIAPAIQLAADIQLNGSDE